MSQGVAQSLDDALLARLLSELGQGARRFRFDVAPNPCVGAAILSGGRVVGMGFHESWGGPHAEVHALAAAAESSTPREDWDTIVVTLEPCSTRGKTDPCVHAIRESGIRRVVVGSIDPHPDHRGRGIEMLRKSGHEVLVLEGASDLSVVAPHFLEWTSHDRMRRARPWTIAKWAQTRTGQLSPPEHVGGGRWISGEESQREVHRLRGKVDAIVTGVGTVLVDGPRLTVRTRVEPPVAPLRVVLDTYLRTPPDSELLAPARAGEAAGQVHVLTQPAPNPERARTLAAAGAQVHGVRTDEEGRIDLRAVQTWLWERGCRRVLLEAGPTLLLEYFARRFVDQVRIYTGEVNGGRGQSLGAWFASTTLRERRDRECGGDAVLEAFLDTD